MVLEFEVEALIQQKKLGSALILETIDTLHERVDTITEDAAALENKFDELLK